MSAIITITKQDEATAALAAMHSKLLPRNRRDMMAVLGRQGANAFKAHFRQKDSESPNKKGWPRQHFWSRLARATVYDPSKTTENSATVAVSDPALAMKVSGGEIRPTGGRRMLAIPLREEAYGHRPSDGTIEGLKVVRMGQRVYLGRLEGGASRSFTKYYLLVPRVRQEADPTALPQPETVMAGLLRVANSFFSRS